MLCEDSRDVSDETWNNGQSYRQAFRRRLWNQGFNKPFKSTDEFAGQTDPIKRDLSTVCRNKECGPSISSQMYPMICIFLSKVPLYLVVSPKREEKEKEGSSLARLVV